MRLLISMEVSHETAQPLRAAALDSRLWIVADERWSGGSCPPTIGHLPKGVTNGRRSLLHDDLSFRGPFEALDSADALMGSIQGLSQIVTGADRRGLFEQGDEAVVIYDLHTKPIPTAPVAEWYTVKSGKIASIQAFFDARPFAAMFEQQGA